MTTYQTAKETYNFKYDDLYIYILKIGRTFVKDGISYNELKTYLGYDGFDMSCSCIEIAVKQWFFDSFHHKGPDGKPVNIEEFDKHLSCRFILKGDAAIKLVEYETSKRNLKIANYALYISVGAVIIQTLFALFENNTLKLSKEQELLIDSLVSNNDIYSKKNTFSYSEKPFLNRQDSVVNIHYHYYIDSLNKTK